MATVLLIVIYAGYISLGIPDSLFGTAWPAIYAEFGLPISYANFVTVIISIGTVLTSFFSARMIRRIGTGRIAAISTALTAVALFGYSVSESFWFICLCSVPLGLGAGAIDSALNNYVAQNYSAAHMNFLHCFYGVGVSVSPYLMSLALSQDLAWRKGYRNAFFIQLFIAVLTIVTLPLWKKVNAKHEEEEKDIEIIKMSEIIKMKGVKAICLAFIGSCTVEVICNAWSSTYFVNVMDVSPEISAKITMFYFIGLSLGRMTAGLLAKKVTSRQLILVGEAITMLAIVLLCFPLPTVAASICLFFIGFGNGPIYPNLMHITPLLFGKARSSSVIGMEMSVAYCAILFSPVLFGQLAEKISFRLFAPTMLVFYGMAAAATALLLRHADKSGAKI